MKKTIKVCEWQSSSNAVLVQAYNSLSSYLNYQIPEKLEESLNELLDYGIIEIVEN